MAAVAVQVSPVRDVVRRLVGMGGWAALLVAASSVAVPELAAQAAPQKVILDTDGDGDYDALVALMLAAVCPEIDLRGVVVTGSDRERSAGMVTKALRLMGRPEVGVYRGEPPTSPPPSFDYFAQFPPRRYDMTPKLESWAADVVPSAPALKGVDFLRREVLDHPGAVTVFVDGPLSSVAEAMNAADHDGSGDAFRRGLKQIYFSGGDFATAEYNVYADVAAARKVFGSGVPIFQFGGESRRKAYLTHERREALWRAGTPATWALQDYYRLYGAGWDPTSPFVPILYDPRLPAFFVRGEAISQFESMAVAVDRDGRLRVAQGERNVRSLVVDHPDPLLAFVQERLSDGIQPAANHLRALRRLCAAPECDAAVDALLADVLGHRAPGGPELERRLGLARSLVPPGAASAAAWHAAMAVGFVQGQRRDRPWRDPYTSPVISAYVMLLILARNKRIILAVLAIVLVGAILARRQRSRRSRGTA